MRNLRGIDLNLLVALDVLLAECHVSRAAARLGVGQPAMSRMLSKLRHIFDDPLLVRTTGGLIPTEHAKELAPQLRNILDQTQQIIEKEEFDPSLSDRQFHIRATSYVMQTFLPDLVSRFHSLAPHASLTVSYLNVHDLGQEQAPGADLAIGSNSISMPENYYRKKLGADNFVCVMSADHPLVNTEMTLDEYLSFAHVQVSMGGGPQNPIDDAIAKLGRKRKKALYVPGGLTGMAMLPGTNMLMNNCLLQVQKVAVPMGLVWRELPFEFPPVDYYMAWHPVHHHHEAHRWLRRLVYMEVKQQFPA